MFLIRLLLESWDKSVLGNHICWVYLYSLILILDFFSHERQIPWLPFLGHHVLSFPGHIVKKLSVVSLDSLALD